MANQLGGVFAPPISDEKLALYREHIEAEGVDPEIREALVELHDCVAAWWELPESVSDPTAHIFKGDVVVPLDAKNQAALFDLIPWTRQLDSMSVLFESLPLGNLRDIAHHLLWFARELDRDREPLTCDKVYSVDQLAALFAGKSKHITQ